VIGHDTLYRSGKALMLAALLAATAYVPFVSGQQLAAGDLRPGPVHCFHQEAIFKAIKGNPQFREPIRISGQLAREISHHVFGLVPPADQIVIIPESNGGSIMVPCAFGHDGVNWQATQANRIKRVEIDQEFRRDLENPKTELPAEKRTRRAK
jgi:hypothetical protein